VFSLFWRQISPAKLVLANPDDGFVAVGELLFQHSVLDLRVVFQNRKVVVAVHNQAVPNDQRAEDSSFLQNVGFQKVQLLEGQRRNFALKLGVNLQPSQHRLLPSAGWGPSE